MQTADAALTDVYKALMAMLDTEEKEAAARPRQDLLR